MFNSVEVSIKRVVSVGGWCPKTFGVEESVKGSGNSGFLQKDQLCYLKRAEKLTFCIYFLIEQHAKLLPFLLMLVDQVKDKKRYLFRKKGGYFKLSGENILTSILSAFHPFLNFTKQNFKARRRYLFFSLKRSLQKREKGPFFAA